MQSRGIFNHNSVELLCTCMYTSRASEGGSKLLIKYLSEIRYTCELSFSRMTFWKGINSSLAHLAEYVPQVTLRWTMQIMQMYSTYSYFIIQLGECKITVGQNGMKSCIQAVWLNH